MDTMNNTLELLRLLQTLLLSFDWIVVFSVTLAGLWRILRGPTTLDRMLGLDALTVCIAALIATEAMRSGRADFIDLVLVVTGLGFLTTVAFYYYLSQKSHKEDLQGSSPSLASSIEKDASS